MEPRTDSSAKPEVVLEEARLSTPQLVREIVGQSEQLLRKQIELATAELKANLRTEGRAFGAVGVAAVVGLCGVNLLLTTGVLGLGTVMPAWAAGLLASAVVLLLAGTLALIGWGHRVHVPLQRTREQLEQDARLAKEGLT